MSEVPNSRQTMHVCDCKATMKFEDIGLPIITSPPVGGTEYCDERVYRPMYVRAHTYLMNHHWRQPRRGCRGHIPPIFWLGNVNRNTPPQYYYVLSDIADQYWLPSVRSTSSRCGEGCSRPTPHPIRWFVPPTLNSR